VRGLGRLRQCFLKINCCGRTVLAFIFGAKIRRTGAYMSIQWGRILVAAFLMELVLFAIAVPLNLSGRGRVNLYVIPPAALVVTFAITIWLGERIKSKFVLHGVLIGAIGTLMYVALTRGGPEPWQYILGNALKVVGGAAGGMVLARRQSPISYPPKAGYST
jgi:hypothetical protein